MSYWEAMENLYHVGARAYDAERGRFTTRDGYRYIDQENPLTANLYLYGQGNPLRFFDLDGHECIEEKSYLERTLEMVILGNFSEEVTLLGIVAGVGLGILGADILLDARDLLADLTVNFNPSSLA